jgi:hypothetical protein
MTSAGLASSPGIPALDREADAALAVPRIWFYRTPGVLRRITPWQVIPNASSDDEPMKVALCVDVAGYQRPIVLSAKYQTVSIMSCMDDTPPVVLSIGHT